MKRKKSIDKHKFYLNKVMKFAFFTLLLYNSVSKKKQATARTAQVVRQQNVALKRQKSENTV